MLLIILLIILDQLTKYFLGDVKNYGAAFGILQGYTTLLIIVSLAVAGVCAYYYKEKNLRVGLSFLLAGTISNLIDRIFLGYVRDFIDLKFWPVFNLADSFNVIGVILIIYLSLKK
ncbi:MAG: Lipoprotein signal peptidase [archaeon GW2011_AR20]|nr:MAG: Lipoprotein signal peptidase [archaeon GW2011_AR20]MBS3160238.1 signal peptidase II [Candidatus Woesearchaeota archaeon]